MSRGAQAAKALEYRSEETLCDGRRIAIRAQRPQDRDALLAAFARTGEEARYRRFFSSKRELSESEIARYTEIDFSRQVALVAELARDGGTVIAGAGRYVVSGPGRAEVAFMVGDEYQGLGIGSLLMRHLAALARAAGLATLEAEVLADNAAMLKVFERAGLALRTRRDGGVVHLQMSLGEERRPG